MAAIAGLRGTGDWGTDERPKNFREMILFRNPNGTAPLFALTSKAGKQTTDDPEFAWWDEPNDLIRMQVNGALTAGATTVVVDSLDPSAASPGLTWGTALNLQPGDHILVEPAADSATYNHEIMQVVSVTNATTFVVTRGVAGTTATAIADDVFLTKLGSAFSEGANGASAVSRNPIKYFNYTQIFKNAYELTGTAEQTNTRTGDPLQNDKKRKTFDHSRDIEMALLFGQRSETTGSNGKPLRTTGGLRTFIPNGILTASWTLPNFLDMVSPVFDFDSMAGDTRMCFCGNAALNYFNKKIAAASGDTATRIQYMGKTSVYGVNVVEYVIPQGRLFLKTHPLMNRHALYQNSMFICDFSAIKWRPMRNRDTKFQDNIQANDADTRKGQWMTEGGLMVDYGGLTMKYVGGFNL